MGQNKLNFFNILHNLQPEAFNKKLESIIPYVLFQYT